MYSSGTTGRPKGVELTQANIIAHTVNAHEGFEFDEGDKNMVSMPLFHVGGSSYVQFGVHDGVPSVMTRDVDGAALAGAILKGANRTFLVPAVLAKVLDAGEDAVKLFGALKTFAYGASPMPLPLLRQALEAWPDTDFMQAYGLTEVCGVISHLLPEAHRDPGREERLSSAGTLVPNAEVRVVDPDTLEDVPTGEQGELWFRTPQLMKGYHNKPEATAEAVTEDGWFRTGDIGRVDDGGYIFVEDRLKDMIISGGENIYSIEVERVLAEHEAVVEVAVIGVPDEKWGEVVKAVVVVESRRPSESDLIAFARERLAAYKCPKSVDITDELPRNPDRQGAEEGTAQTALGRPRPRHGLDRDDDLVAAPERQCPRRIVEPGGRLAGGLDAVVPQCVPQLLAARRDGRGAAVAAEREHRDGLRRHRDQPDVSSSGVGQGLHRPLRRHEEPDRPPVARRCPSARPARSWRSPPWPTAGSPARSSRSRCRGGCRRRCNQRAGGSRC